MEHQIFHTEPLQKFSFSISEAEKALGISHATIYEIINNGQLQTYRIGRRRFISSDALHDFIKQREREEEGYSNA